MRRLDTDRSLAVRMLLGGLLFLGMCAWVSFSWSTRHASGKRHGRATQGMDCGVCHTPAGWGVRSDLQSGSEFDHDLTGFPLRAGHVRAACTQCHDGRKEVERRCVSCHVDEHRGKLGTQCDDCHNASSFKRTDALTLHSRTRLPLTGMHALVDCADCHRRQTSDTYTSLPSQCFACHEADYRRRNLHPVHDGSSGELPFSRQCTECHQTSSFSPAIVDPSRFSMQSQSLALDARSHDRAFLLSHGPHRGAPCASCHVELRAPRAVRCTGCHAHENRKLTAQHPNLGTPTDGSCMGCHAGGFGR